MILEGSQTVAAPLQKVWDALNDPEVLRQCIPGCQSLERTAPDSFVATAEIKIGPIGARFKGAVTLSDIDAPNGYTISGQGNGGIAGNAKGAAKVRLVEQGGQTVVSYSVDSEVGGRMAQLGGPIIDATAKQLAAKFFARFGEVVTGAATIAASGNTAAIAPAFPANSSPSKPWAWLTAMVVAILAGFLVGRSPVGEAWLVAVMVLGVVAALAGFEAGRRGAGR